MAGSAVALGAGAEATSPVQQPSKLPGRSSNWDAGQIPRSSRCPAVADAFDCLPVRHAVNPEWQGAPHAPILTTGQLFLHSCLHFLGLHLRGCHAKHGWTGNRFARGPRSAACCAAVQSALHIVRAERSSHMWRFDAPMHSAARHPLARAEQSLHALVLADDGDTRQRLLATSLVLFGRHGCPLARSGERKELGRRRRRVGGRTPRAQLEHAADCSGRLRAGRPGKRAT